MSQSLGRGSGTDEAPLSADDHAELQRLRLEVETLRAARSAPGRIRWRSVASAVLLTLGCALAPVSLVAVWTHSTISDTDRFVQTVGPLAADPAVQGALTDRITTTLFQQIDVQGLTDEAITALGAQGLPPQIAQRLQAFTPALTTAVTGFVHGKVAEVVAGPQFASAWDQAVRVAQQQAVGLLSGTSQDLVVRNGSLYLDLGPFIDIAKQHLVDAGLRVAGAIPEVNPQIAIAPATGVVKAQSAYRVLGSLATVLPWITLLLLASGVYLARNRMRAVVAAGLGVGLGILVLAAGLLVARGLLVDAVPPTGVAAAASAYDLVVEPLRLSGRVVLVLGLVVALGAFLAGGSTTAVGLRRWATGMLMRIRGGRSPSGPVGTWVGTNLRLLRTAAVALAVLIFVFVSRPTGVTIVLIAAGLLVVLAALEFLGRPERPVDAAGG